MVKTVAEILGSNKISEIQAKNSSPEFRGYLTYLVRESDFHQDGENTWAYRKVATFLEDGWQSQRQYTRLKAGCGLTLDELGQAMNHIVGGTRYDKAKAQAIGCMWTPDGVWPTLADLGAFLFVVCVDESPQNNSTWFDEAIRTIDSMPTMLIMGMPKVERSALEE